MDLTVILIAVVFVLVALWWRSSNERQPPGPWCLPIVGYFPFLTRQPYVKLAELSKKYGSIFRIRLGSFNVVVLNDFQSAKDAFAQDAFLGRPPTLPFGMSKETIENGAFYDLPWREQRRFSLHMLRDLGLGKTKMEDHVQEEISELLEHIEKEEGKPFCLRPLLGSSMSNNVASLIFGKRLKYDDPIRNMLTRTVNEVSKGLGMTGWLIFFPWIKNVFRFLGIADVDRVEKLTVDMREYMIKEIEEHENTLNPDNIRDFIDGYLMEIKKRQNDPCFSKSVLKDIAGAFFGAGSETVRQSVEWLLLLVATQPEAQRRIQAEIREGVGQSRLPIWQDCKSMPFTDAFIMEVMRWRTLLPLNILRYTLTDTQVNGYFIPKHTMIIANLWAIHYDKNIWGEDAEIFRPERFLAQEGKETPKHDWLIPFSIGKRSCPGERLARMEVFLYFVAILQRFDVSMPEGKEADFEGELGIGLQPKPQELVLKKRE